MAAYDTVNLAPHLEKIARETLNETPENRMIGLEKMRKLMSEHPLPYGRSDDAYLLPFLRAKKFRVSDAFEVLKNFTNYWEEHKTLDLDPEKIKPLYEQGYTRVLPGSDRLGRRLSTLLPSKMIFTDDFDSTDMLKFNLLLVRHVLWDPEMQVNGMVVVENFDGFKLGDAIKMQMKLDQKVMKKLMAMMQDTMPVRLQGIWVMNQPSYMSVLWAIVRPFMKKKMRKRVLLLGDDYSQLEARIDMSNLPPEFGGTLMEHPMAYWEILTSGRPCTDYFQPTSA